MSVSAYFANVLKGELRMPRGKPGYPHKNGILFHGPVLNGEIDPMTAIERDEANARLRTEVQGHAGPEAIAAPAANGLPPLSAEALAAGRWLDKPMPKFDDNVLMMAPPTAPEPNIDEVSEALARRHAARVRRRRRQAEKRRTDPPQPA